MQLCERAQQLAEQLIGPLVLGEIVRPVRPVGPELGLQLGQVQRIADDALRMNVDQARTRRARQIVAVDALTELDPAEWALAAALNDLLQVTNEELSGFGTRSRHTVLLHATRALCERIPPPANLYQAVARHATFAELLGLTRTDTKVSWWTGSALLRGQPPPTRLLRWPKLRRVSIQQTNVPLAEMAAWAPVEPNEYQHTLGLLLSCSPLTDLATANRDKPPFAWTRHTLAVVSTTPGRDLALRAFARQEPSVAVWSRSCGQSGARAAEALAQAGAMLPPGPALRSTADAFVACLRQAIASWTANETAAVENLRQ